LLPASSIEREVPLAFLNQVLLTNFRSFPTAQIDFDDHGLILIAGANNSGKSALLSAFDLVAGKGSPGEYRYVGGSRAEVTATFTLSDEDQREIVTRTGLKPLMRATISPFQAQWGFKDNQSGLVATELRVVWGDRQFYVARWDGDEAKFLAVRGPALMEPEPQLVEIQRAAGSLENGLQALPELAVWLSHLTEWRQRYYSLPTLRPGSQRETGLRTDPKLAPSGDNLPAVLLHMQHHDPTNFAVLQKLMAQIVPEVGNVSALPSGTQNSVVVRDPLRPVEMRNLQDLGEGVEQLLMLLVIGLTERSPHTITLEEPENGLHPAAQRAMLGLLREWSTDRLIVAATHSAVMLDIGAQSDQVLTVTRKEGASSVQRADAHLATALNALGVRLSDVLASDRVLLVEGQSDERILAVWFPELLRSQRTALIEAGGGDSARQVSLFQEWISKADRYITRKVLFLRDRDELPKEQLDKLEKTPHVYVMNCREIENYLLDEQAIATVLSRGIGEPIEPEVISHALDETVDGLKQGVILRTVCWRLQLDPNRLMDHTGRKVLSAKNAGIDDLLQFVQRRLRDPEAIEKSIRTMWNEADREITARWPSERLGLAPGEEVLQSLWGRLGGRKYRKDEDGPQIAAEMGEPPADLAAIVEAFLTDED
jgi:predicted ATPase